MLAVAKQKDSLNYYFLNRFLHPKPYPGYKQSVISLIINKNKGKNANKFLFVQEKTGYWFLPKSGIETKNLADGFISAIARGLEKELGLRGMAVYKIKPQFTQSAYVFDFDRQTYNKERTKQEKEKKNPSKGKVYHLATMYYKGDDDFDLNSGKDIDVLDYKWVNQQEAEELVKANNKLMDNNPGYTESYLDFQKRLLDKVMNAQETVEVLKSEKGVVQKRLI